MTVTVTGCLLRFLDVEHCWEVAVQVKAGQSACNVADPKMTMTMTTIRMIMSDLSYPCFFIIAICIYIHYNIINCFHAQYSF